MIGKNKITLLQYIILVHSVQIGVGILTFPRELAKTAGTDGWITVIICWLLSTTASLVIVAVMKKYPNGTILDLLTNHFGKFVGKLCTLLFALYFAVFSGVVFIREALFIQAWILPQTNVYMLILLLSIPSYLIVRRSITILGRYAEFVFFMTLWTILVFILTLKDAQWLNLLPVLKEGWGPILIGVKTAIFPFVGFEIAFFLYPFLEKKEQASVGVIVANTLTLIAYLIIVIGAFAFYSPDEITTYNEPTIVMLKVLEFKFIERLEIVFFSFYIFMMSTTVLPLMFTAVYCFTQLTGGKGHRVHTLWLLLIGFFYVLLIPPTFERNKMAQGVVEQAGWIIAYVFPLVLWGYTSLYGLFKRRMVK